MQKRRRYLFSAMDKEEFVLGSGLDRLTAGSGPRSARRDSPTSAGFFFVSSDSHISSHTRTVPGDVV